MDDLSGSEDEYSENDRILLENARKSLTKRSADSEEEEVFGLDVDDDDEDTGLLHGGGAEEEEDDVDMHSDLEDGQDGVPDDRAWGKRKRNFYNTDFVDQDYGGVLQDKEAEAAELEEQEARNIQKRLVEQLNDADFSLGAIAEVAAVETKEVIKSDLTLLSKRQKLDLFAKESPEFANLVEDFKVKMTEVQDKLMPVVELVKGRQVLPSATIDFINTKLHIILNYCTNISFYLLLKSKRIPVKDHPVLKSLFRYRQLLEQLSPLDKIVGPQIDKVLPLLKSSEPVLQPPASKKKKVLKLLKKEKRKSAKVGSEEEKGEGIIAEVETADLPDSSSSEEEAEEVKSSGKRAITYEMAKNKGLIPKRSKEQRNPRVKHRNRFRKATIRRRGQVRTARPEIPLYGGEPGGIKIGLTKSIKLK